MQQALRSVKSLDAELKKNEAAYKASGDKETYMSDKGTLLNKKLAEQKKAVDQAKKALDEMNKSGKQSTKAYQDMQLALVKAETGMLETTASLNALERGEIAAAKGADQLTTSVGNISKKVSLDAVVSGIDKLSSGLEKAAKRAVQFGKAMVEEVLDTASWADDVATMASKLSMSVEEYQRYQGVFDTVADITVQDWRKAQKKIQSAINNPTQDQVDVLAALGIKTHGTQRTDFGIVQGAARNYEDVLWEVGETLRKRVESGAMTQDLADTYAMQVFGRGFDDLKPLFDLGREGFEKAKAAVKPVSEETITNLAEMNDKIEDLKRNFRTLEAEVLGGMAPALKGAAEVLSTLLTNLVDYLQKPEGQEMLERMRTAVEGLFSDLSQIDPELVVSGFTEVFNKIVESFQWLYNNKDTIADILKGIAVAWGTVKITGGALKMYELISGLKGLNAGTVATAGEAAGAAWGSGFAKAVMAAAPWLVGVYTLLNPAETGSNDLYDKNGTLTGEGYSAFQQDLKLWDNGDVGQYTDAISMAAELFGDMDRIRTDAQAAAAIMKYAADNNRESLVTTMQALGYTLQKNGGVQTATGNAVPPNPWELSGYAMTTNKPPVYSGSAAGGVVNMGPNPWELSGYAMTSEANKPKWLNNHLWWNGYGADYSDRESEWGKNGTWNPEELTTKTDNLEGSFVKLNDSLPVTDDQIEKLGDKSVEATGHVGEFGERAGGAEGPVTDLGTAAGAAAAVLASIKAPDLSGFSHANGLPFVPFDGYIAQLHRGERVVPAREAGSSRNYSSNLYVESMYMNNGQDADGLAAAMAAAQRRTMSGYGS